MYEKSLRWEYFRRVQILSPHYSAFCLTSCQEGATESIDLTEAHLWKLFDVAIFDWDMVTRHVQDIYTRCNGWSFSRSSVLGSQMLLTVVKKAICKLKVYSWAGMYELSLWDETVQTTPHRDNTTVSFRHLFLFFSPFSSSWAFCCAFRFASAIRWAWIWWSPLRSSRWALGHFWTEQFDQFVGSVAIYCIFFNEMNFNKLNRYLAPWNHLLCIMLDRFQWLLQRWISCNERTVSVSKLDVDQDDIDFDWLTTIFKTMAGSIGLARRQGEEEWPQSEWQGEWEQNRTFQSRSCRFWSGV